MKIENTSKALIRNVINNSTMEILGSRRHVHKCVPWIELVRLGQSNYKEKEVLKKAKNYFMKAQKLQ